MERPHPAAREPDAGPLVGEDTETVPTSLGHDKETIAGWRAQRACV